MSMSASLVANYKRAGWVPNLPLIIIPGLCSSMLYAEESPYEPWKGKRIWLSLNAIGLGKVWDFNVPLFARNKKPDENTPEGEDRVADVDSTVKRRWIQHVVMGQDLINDPPGIKLRPVKGLYGCSYLDPGALTKSASYVFGPFIETLQALGYTDDNLRAATYDWRVPPGVTESRDGYLTELKEMILDMYRLSEKKKVVLLGHSLGSKMVLYFLRWADANFGRQWISDHIETFMAVGPLFLGAAKAIRGPISGERMGLEPLLYPKEGVMLSRGCGSGPWMFPVKTPDFEFMSHFALVRNAKGEYEQRDLEQLLKEGDVGTMYQLYQKHYVEDPFYGPPEDALKPPPVDKIYAIYGVNLDTEIFYFFRKGKPPKSLTSLELDPEGSIPNYKCKGGIAFETSKTKQNFLRGKPKSGDGTVPYVSLAYCTRWTDKIDVRVEELELCDHRAILADKRFTKAVIEYVCKGPPTYELPDSFPNLEYTANMRRNRMVPVKVTLTRKGVDIQRIGARQKIMVPYRDLQNIVKNDSDDVSFFLVEDGNEDRPVELQTQYRQEMMGEIAVRCRLIDRLVSGESIEEEKRDENGQTMLHRAAASNDVEQVYEVMARKCDVNCVDKNGWTALHIAAQEGYLDVVEALLESDELNVNQVNKDGTSAFHYLLRVNPTNEEEVQRFTKVWDVMKDAGANINLAGKSGETPLHQAVRRSNKSAVSWLIKNRCNVNARTDFGETPLHYAIRSESVEIVQMLLDAGADKHTQSQDGTPFALARKVSPEIFKCLCGNATQVQAQNNQAMGRVDEYGQTDLHKAAFDNQLDLLFIYLQKSPASINSQDRNGWTPLHSAASQGHLDALLVLLSMGNGVDPTIVTNNGSTVIHYLVKHNPADAVALQKLDQALEKLANLGADMKQKDKFGDSAIHVAVFRGNMHAAKWLLSREDVDVNSTNSQGETPLHYAVRSQNLEMVKLLVKVGADPLINSQLDGNCIDLANKIKANNDIIECLKSSSFYTENIAKSLSKVAVPKPPVRRIDTKRSQLRMSMMISSSTTGSDWQFSADDIAEDEDDEDDDDDDEEEAPSAPTSTASVRGLPNRPTRVRPQNSESQRSIHEKLKAGTVMFSRKDSGDKVTALLKEKPAPPARKFQSNIRGGAGGVGGQGGPARPRPPQPGGRGQLQQQNTPPTGTPPQSPQNPNGLARTPSPQGEHIPAVQSKRLPGRGGGPMRAARGGSAIEMRNVSKEPSTPPFSGTQSLNSVNNGGAPAKNPVHANVGSVSNPGSPALGRPLRPAPAPPPSGKPIRPARALSGSISKEIQEISNELEIVYSKIVESTNSSNNWTVNASSKDGRITAQVDKSGNVSVLGFPLDPSILEAIRLAYQARGDRVTKEKAAIIDANISDPSIKMQLNNIVNNTT